MSRLVVLVAGPPGAGKTTRARLLAAADGLTVYDRDDPEWTSERQFTVALTNLVAPGARAVVIRACASRSAYEDLRGHILPSRVELLDPGADVCRQRIVQDARTYTGATWRDQRSRLAGVTTWYRTHTADPWRPPPPPRSSRWAQ